MRRFSRSLAVGIVFAGIIGSTQAADVLLVANSPTEDLAVGEIVEMDVFINFADIPGGTLGGGFDITYDSTAFSVFSLSSAALGDSAMRRDPDMLANLLESWAVGEFGGLAGSGQVLVGTVQFEVLSTEVSATQISVGPTSSLGGPWISGDDFVSELTPGYNQIDITINPDSLLKEGFESP